MNGNNGFLERNQLNVFLALGLALGLNLSVKAALPLVILNEYNAVNTNQYLKGGKFDPAFGNRPVAGNGGSWFELLVMGSNPQALTPAGTTVDMRGWTLEWKSREWQNLDWQIQTSGQTNAGNSPKSISGKFKLSNDPFWQNIRSGMIITFTANNAQQGGKDTDTVFDPTQGKWNVNVWAGEQSLVKVKGSPLDTTGRRWQLTIKDGNDQLIFGPAGDGALPKTHTRSNQVFKLEEPSPEVVTNSDTANYTSGSTSTFGQPNAWEGGASGEDVSVLRSWAQQ